MPELSNKIHRLEQLWQQQNWPQLEETCLDLLMDDPNCHIAHHILGKLYFINQNFDASISHLKSAVNIERGDGEAWLFLGKCMLVRQKWPEATVNMQMAYTLLPTNPDCTYHYAFALENIGRTDDAIPIYKTTIKLQPDKIEALTNLANIYQRINKYADAIIYFKKALSYDTNNKGLIDRLSTTQVLSGNFLDAAETVRIYNRKSNTDILLHIRIHALEALGEKRSSMALLLEDIEHLLTHTLKDNSSNVKLDISDLKIAATAYDKIITFDSPIEKVLVARLKNLAKIYKLAKMQNERNACLEKIIQILEDDNSLIELGLIESTKKNWEKAEQLFRRALKANPKNTDALIDLGAVYMMGKPIPDYKRAIEYLERAASLHGSSGIALQNLGLAYHRNGDKRAVPTLRKAVMLRPNDPEAHNNLALALLNCGMLKEGWNEYEWRIHTVEHRKRSFPYPAWQGEDLEGKTILAYAEQGIGDEILFASCIPDLLELGGNCIIECDQRLVSIFQRSFPASTVVARDSNDKPPNLTGPNTPNYHISLGSLPKFFRKTSNDFPDKLQHLDADPELVDQWKIRLDKLGPGKKIGISWRSGYCGFGRPVYPALTAWAPLFDLTTNCLFINLQYDKSDHDIAELSESTKARLVTFDDIDLRNDIEQLAALLCALDITICVANINSALGGALGLPIIRLNGGKVDPMKLGEKFYPWFPSTTLIPPDNFVFSLLFCIGAWQRGFKAADADTVATDLAKKGFLSLSLKHMTKKNSSEMSTTPFSNFLKQLNNLPTFSINQSSPESSKKLRQLLAEQDNATAALENIISGDELLYYIDDNLSDTDLINILRVCIKYMEASIPVPESFLKTLELLENKIEDILKNFKFRTENIKHYRVLLSSLSYPYYRERLMILLAGLFSKHGDMKHFWLAMRTYNNRTNEYKTVKKTSKRVIINAETSFPYIISLYSPYLNYINEANNNYAIQVKEPFKALLSRSFKNLTFFCSHEKDNFIADYENITAIEDIIIDNLNSINRTLPQNSHLTPDDELVTKYKNKLKVHSPPYIFYHLARSDRTSWKSHSKSTPYTVLTKSDKPNPAHNIFDEEIQILLTTPGISADLFDKYVALFHCMDFVICDTSMAVCSSSCGRETLFIDSDNDSTLASHILFPDTGKDSIFTPLHRITDIKIDNDDGIIENIITELGNA